LKILQWSGVTSLENEELPGPYLEGRLEEQRVPIDHEKANIEEHCITKCWVDSEKNIRSPVRSFFVKEFAQMLIVGPIGINRERYF
jgi:hypothetical protein